MEILAIILGGTVGTILMTAFSYIVSRVQGKQFREPVLLNKLIDRWVDLQVLPYRSNPAGWALHFGVGILFVAIFHLIWVYTSISPTWLSGAAMGGISGLVGIGIWYITFMLHPNPPRVEIFGFFTQLFVAHIIFGLGAVLGYWLPFWLA